MIKLDMTANEVVEKMDMAQFNLEQLNEDLKTYSIEVAESNKRYSIALSEEILRLKAERCQATLIQNIAKGNERVATLKFNCDIAESKYTSCRNALENLKCEIDMLRSLLSFIKEDLKRG